MTRSFDASYFDRLNAENPDPWSFTGSAYEQEKYAASLDALPEPHYASVLEVGCSIGIFTRLLAARCDRLLAVDIAADALAQARNHCSELAHVSLAQAQIPRNWPGGQYDLTVLSEVLYFLDETDIHATAAASLSTRAPDGVILLVHWLGPTNYRRGARQRLLFSSRRPDCRAGVADRQNSTGSSCWDERSQIGTAATCPGFGRIPASYSGAPQ